MIQYMINKYLKDIPSYDDVYCDNEYNRGFIIYLYDMILMMVCRFENTQAGLVQDIPRKYHFADMSCDREKDR